MIVPGLRHGQGSEVQLLVLSEDAFTAPVRGAAPDFADSDDYDFVILHLTDTQYLAEGAAQTRGPQKQARSQAAIDAITGWIAENARKGKVASRRPSG